MKIDIARQPLVPAFMTLFALAVAAMCAGIPVSDTSGAVRDALPLLGGQLARFQAAYPVWSKFAAGFMLLFTGMCAGRITIRYNLYTVGTCLPIPLYAIVACGIATGGNYLAGFAASMLLALATKNYCRAFCNGYGFDAIFRASLYLGLMPLVYAPGLPMLLLLPLVMGISYELLKWCGRSDNIATRIIRQPGIWVQHLTVFEPDDSMIEVAIAAVTPVLPEDPEDGRW